MFDRGDGRSGEIAGEAVLRGRVAWEDLVESRAGEVVGNGFAEDVAEIGGDGEVPVLVELFGGEAGPAAVDFASVDGTSENEHGVGVAVVGAAVAVLFGGAAKFGHGDEDNFFR